MLEAGSSAPADRRWLVHRFDDGWGQDPGKSWVFLSICHSNATGSFAMTGERKLDPNVIMRAPLVTLIDPTLE
jgi:hypothetical protein